MAAQSRDEPAPYSRPARTMSGVPSARYRSAASKIVSCSPVGWCAVKPPSTPGASRFRKRMFANCSPMHDPVVAAPRAVGVEVALHDSAIAQMAPGGGVERDVAGGRDVIGGHRIAAVHQHPSVLDIGDLGRLGRHAGEERRLLDVGRGVVPGVEIASVHRNRVPGRIAVPDVVVHPAEGVGADGRLERRMHLVGRGPDGRADGPAFRRRRSRAALSRGGRRPRVPASA